MICTYGLSITGRSHKKSGTVCQDSHKIKMLSNGWIAAAVADGVGSSKYSDTASLTAVNTVVDHIGKILNTCSEWDDQRNKVIMEEAFINALDGIYDKALEDNNFISDYDTTLTALLYNGSKIVYGHSGDGGIIGLTAEGNYIPVTSVQKGDEHNVVIPLRTGISEWVFASSEHEFCSLLLLTDGILDVMTPSLLNGGVYIRFAMQFMDNKCIGFNGDDQYDAEKFKSNVYDFFSGDTCKSITDDITIVGIINCGTTPAEKEPSYYDEPDWRMLKNERYKKLYP